MANDTKFPATFSPLGQLEDIVNCITNAVDCAVLIGSRSESEHVKSTASRLLSTLGFASTLVSDLADDVSDEMDKAARDGRRAERDQAHATGDILESVVR